MQYTTLPHLASKYSSIPRADGQIFTFINFYNSSSFIVQACLNGVFIIDMIICKIYCYLISPSIFLNTSRTGNFLLIRIR